MPIICVGLTLFNIGWFFLPIQRQKFKSFALSSTILLGIYAYFQIAQVHVYIFFIGFALLTYLFKRYQLLNFELFWVTAYIVFSILQLATVLMLNYLSVPFFYQLAFFSNFIIINLLIFLLRRLFTKNKILLQIRETIQDNFAFLGIELGVAYLLNLILTGRYTQYLVKLQNSSLLINLSLLVIVMISAICLYLFINRLTLEHRLNQAIAEQQDILRSYVNQIKMQKHDFNTHLSTIHGLAKQQDYQSLGQYIQEMLDDYDDINQTIIVAIPEVSALIFQYKQLAQNKNIAFDFILNSNLDKLPLPFYTFNKILGNLISNALEAAMLSEEKKVSVEISENSENFKLSIANSGTITEEVLNEMFDVGVSHKKAADHGFGLPIVKSILDGIQGTIDFISDKNSVICLVAIPKKNDSRIY
jgi:signal transduction histidine kinase